MPRIYKVEFYERGEPATPYVLAMDVPDDVLGDWVGPNDYQLTLESAVRDAFATMAEEMMDYWRDYQSSMEGVARDHAALAAFEDPNDMEVEVLDFKEQQQERLDDAADYEDDDPEQDRLDAEEAERRLRDEGDRAVPYDQVRRELGLDANEATEEDR